VGRGRGVVEGPEADDVGSLGICHGAGGAHGVGLADSREAQGGDAGDQGCGGRAQARGQGRVCQAGGRRVLGKVRHGQEGRWLAAGDCGEGGEGEPARARAARGVRRARLVRKRRHALQRRGRARLGGSGRTTEKQGGERVGARGPVHAGEGGGAAGEREQGTGGGWARPARGSRGPAAAAQGRGSRGPAAAAQGQARVEPAVLGRGPAAAGRSPWRLGEDLNLNQS
jgi:hypothetical protein